jgi:hypothetical protein
LEVGSFDAAQDLNFEVAAQSVISANAIGGTLGTAGRPWPAVFGAYGIAASEQFPNMAVRVRRPA